MRIKQILIIITLLIINSCVFAQSKITITCNLPDAHFYKMDGTTIIEPALGIGSIQFRLRNRSLNKIKIVRQGYQSVIKTFPKTRKWGKTIAVNLDNRIIDISCEPFDAQIYIDGKLVGSKSIQMIIKKDASATIELKKIGFSDISKTYYNREGNKIPFKVNLKLETRLVHIKTNPIESEIFVDNKKVGIGSAQIIIPIDQCVIVSVNKNGFIGEQEIFCNKEQEKKAPLNHLFILKDRLVEIMTTPKSSEISINGRVVGIGSYKLKLLEGNCVEVTARQEGYLGITKNYCNSKNYQQAPISDHLELIEDEAYKTSISTDLANVNFVVEVKHNLEEKEAWKLLSSIITTQFDVLEVTDKETGYLRTAWEVRSFNGKSTIRTRVIVKLGDSNPLKYIIKICSERAQGVVSVKDDQEFEEWNRILKKYKNIIEEAQSRL